MAIKFFYDIVRIILLMVFAIVGMIIWIIFSHNLWEKKGYIIQLDLGIYIMHLRF